MSAKMLNKIAEALFSKIAKEEWDIDWDLVYSLVDDKTDVISLKAKFNELDRVPYTDVEAKREYAESIIPLILSILKENGTSEHFETLKGEMHKLYKLVEMASSEERTVAEMEEDKAHQKYEESKEQAREEYNPSQRKERYERRKEFLDKLKETNPGLYEEIKEQERARKREDKKRRRQDPAVREKEKEYYKERRRRLKEQDPEGYRSKVKEQRERSKQRKLQKQLAAANEWFEGLGDEEKNHIKVMFDYMRKQEQEK
jgi:hypothetical protein